MKTVDAEIKRKGHFQRARDAGIRAERRFANGPQRARAKIGQPVEYAATRRHALVAGDMLVSC